MDTEEKTSIFSKLKRRRKTSHSKAAKKNSRRWWLERFGIRLIYRFKQKKTFILSILITYILTLILTCGIVMLQMNIDNSSNGDMPNYSFYNCTSLNASQFTASKIVEAFIPTTITFCATVLLLQTDTAQKQTITVWLFVSITLLVVGGILLPTVKAEVTLMRFLFALCILCVISLALSWKAFSESDLRATGHKSEPCDGKTVY